MAGYGNVTKSEFLSSLESAANFINHKKERKTGEPYECQVVDGRLDFMFNIKTPSEAKRCLDWVENFIGWKLGSFADLAIQYDTDVDDDYAVISVIFKDDVFESKSVLNRILDGEDVRTVLLNENQTINEAPQLTRDQVAQLDVDAIFPQQKDIDRAEGLSFSRHTFHGNGAPFSKEASKMAKLITDPYKLVRRAKAVVQKWGTDAYNGENVWIPFRDRLLSMGFTPEQIEIIADFEG